MKIDRTNGALFTDAGKFLKRLHCPQAARWSEMTAAPGTATTRRTCAHCAHIVHDTAAMTDADLEQLLDRDPTACLKISLAQSNCTILPSNP